MEGIVRKIWKQNPSADIVFFYTIHKVMTEKLEAGEIPKVIKIMEEVADHYGIPSINGGYSAYLLAKQGKLNMSGLPVYKGMQRLTKDDCHPNPYGHRLYGEYISSALESMLKTEAKAAAHKVPAPISKDNYENAKMLDPSEALVFSDGWTKKPGGRYGARMPVIWSASKPGSTAAIKFKGDGLLFFDVIGPDTGQYSVTVDGKPDGNGCVSINTAPIPDFIGRVWCQGLIPKKYIRSKSQFWRSVRLLPVIKKGSPRAQPFISAA
jgi:hypothetical protein